MGVWHLHGGDLQPASKGVGKLSSPTLRDGERHEFKSELTQKRDKAPTSVAIEPGFMKREACDSFTHKSPKS